MTEDCHVVLMFPRDIVKINKVTLITKIKKRLPEHFSVFDSGGYNKCECITIMAVIKREIVLSHQAEFQAAIDEYIKTCWELKSQLVNETIGNEWEHYEHGFEICFTNKQTGQVVEVPLKGEMALKDVDPYFLGIFLKTTESYKEISKLIRHDFHDTAKILEILRA